MKRLALLAVSVLLLAGCGAFGAAGAHTLSLAYKAGDTYKYKLHASSKQTVTTSEISFPLNFDISADESIKVKSVDSSGTADLAITLSNLTMKSTMGGVSNTTTGVPAQTINVQVGADGRLVSVEGNQLPGGTPMEAFSGLGGGFFITAVLPAKPVKPGDTWTKDYDQANPNGTGGTHVTSKSTYLRDESLNGVNAAVVETKSTMTIDMTIDDSSSSSELGMSGLTMKGTVTTDVTTWVDPDGHRVMKTHSTAADDATIDLKLPPTRLSPPATAGPGLSGPMSAKGEATTDLTPA
jgi:hypothetical protein